MTERDDRQPTRRNTTVVLVAVVLGLLAFWGTAKSCGWFLDVPFVMRPSDTLNALESARFLTGPEALLTQCLALYVVPSALGAAWLLRGRARPFERIAGFLEGDPRVVPVLAATVAVIGAAFVGYALLDHTELLDDERSYLFQADLFAHGRTHGPGLPEAFRNQMLLVDPVQTSKYPPGNALLLALGVLLHAPHMVEPLLAGLLVLAVHAFVRDAYGERHAHLAAMLTALSPFTWAIFGTSLSFGPAAVAFALTIAGLARHEKTGSTTSSFVAGLGAGALFVIRPFDAAVLAAPALLFGARRAPKRSRFALASVLGVAALAWLIPWHNHAITGSYTVMPYTLDHANPMHLGFTRPFAGPYEHSLAGSAAVEATLLLRLDGWLLGFPGALLLAAVGLLRRDGLPATALLRLLLATFLAAFVIVPAPGTWDVGPTYGYVLLPVLVPAATRGASWAFGAATRQGPATRDVAEWALLALLAAGMLSATPLRFARLTLLAREIRAPWDFIASSGAGDVVVVVPRTRGRAAAGWGFGYPYEIDTSPSTKARLFIPLNRAEYDAGMKHLGATSALRLTVDEDAFFRTSERRFQLLPVDPEKLWPTAPTNHKGAP